MNRMMKTAASLLFALLIPGLAAAELRRVEIKVLGMD